MVSSKVVTVAFALITLLTGASCISKHARFERNRFQHETYPYAVWYSKGAGPAEVLGSDWRVDNFDSSDGSPLPDQPKAGADYEVRRTYDTNGDGSHESGRLEPFYDLLLKHRKKEAVLWIRSVPMDLSDANKELPVFATRYLDLVAGLGSVTVRFGADGPATLLDRRFTARKLGERSCALSGKPAHRIDFEVSRDERWLHGSLVITAPGYTNTVTTSSGTEVHYPVLMLIGLAANQEDYPSLEPELDRLLSQLVLSDPYQGLPLQGKHTCQIGMGNEGAQIPN